jgi:hypothetical protein
MEPFMAWKDARAEHPETAQMLVAYSTTGAFNVGTFERGAFQVSRGSREDWSEILAWHPLEPVPESFVPS